MAEAPEGIYTEYANTPNNKEKAEEQREVNKGRFNKYINNIPSTESMTIGSVETQVNGSPEAGQIPAQQEVNPEQLKTELQKAELEKRTAEAGIKQAQKEQENIKLQTEQVKSMQAAEAAKQARELRSRHPEIKEYEESGIIAQKKALATQSELNEQIYKKQLEEQKIRTSLAKLEQRRAQAAQAQALFGGIKTALNSAPQIERLTVPQGTPQAVSELVQGDYILNAIGGASPQVGNGNELLTEIGGSSPPTQSTVTVQPATEPPQEARVEVEEYKPKYVFKKATKRKHEHAGRPRKRGRPSKSALRAREREKARA